MILNNMIVRIVVDGYILDAESGEVLNIVSEFFEKEHVWVDLSSTIRDDEGNYVPATVSCVEAEITEVHLLEMKHIECIGINLLTKLTITWRNFNGSVDTTHVD